MRKRAILRNRSRLGIESSQLITAAATKPTAVERTTWVVNRSSIGVGAIERRAKTTTIATIESGAVANPTKATIESTKTAVEATGSDTQGKPASTKTTPTIKLGF